MIAFNRRNAVLLAVLLALADAVYAQANLNIDTPAIATLRKSLRERYEKQLAPLYANGAIGLTRDGSVALRDANLVPLAQRAQVNSLVADSNQDLAALYR